MRELGAYLARLAERWQLPAGAATSLERLLGLLAEDPEAPTAVADPLEAVEVHVADSLTALELDRFRSVPDLVDIGSGAGFPGLVLAIAMPGTRVDLLESSQRKCAFLARVVDALDLPNVDVICSRSEHWAAGEGRERYRAATARAVAPLATLVEYAAPLLQTGGLLVAWKGRRAADEESQAVAAARELAMRPLPAVKAEPFAGSRSRHLHGYEKVAPTPARYPRRAGMAKKRPLGGRRSRASGVSG
jgi:16S rRNA (guanine527-N7)-methyltransferase